MSKNANVGCTLMCYFQEGLTYIPTRNEMLYWLKNQSGLPDEYMQKIVSVQYNHNEGLTITFDKTLNCFMAMREIKIKNRVLYGHYGRFDIEVFCPRGTFEALHLWPDEGLLLTRDDVIDTFKEYGEIIEMRDIKWYDSTEEEHLPNGNVDVRMLSKALYSSLPETVTIRGVDTRVFIMLYDFEYTDEILWKLWDNCDTSTEIDYSRKTFQMKNEWPNCTVEIIFDIDHALPEDGLVYEWLVKYSGLSKEHRQKIIAFKNYCPVRYEVVFGPSVNCLLATQEMNYDVSDINGLRSKAKIKCTRGDFIDVILIPKNADMLLTRLAVEKALEPYGIILECRKNSHPSQHNHRKISLSFKEMRCKMFQTSELPEKLKLNEHYLDIITCTVERENLDKAFLDSLWNRLKIRAEGDSAN